MEDESIKLSPNASYYDEFFYFEGMGADYLHCLLSNSGRYNRGKRFIRVSSLKDKALEKVCSGGYEILTKPILIEFLDDGKKSRWFNDERFLIELRDLAKRALYSALDDDLHPKLEADIGDKIDFSRLAVELFDSSRKTFFFGQENASYGIGPSIFDKQKELGEDTAGIVYDRESLYELYREDGYCRSLLRRYNECFGKQIWGPDGICYSFLSWMQNAASFSPLMDFTSDYGVALMRALKSRNPGTFMYKDSAIYILSVPNEFVTDDIAEADRAIKGMKHIVYLRDKIVPGTSGIQAEHRFGRKKSLPLDFSTYEDILNLLVPKVTVMDIPSNGSTSRRCGKYVFFHDCVAVKGKVFAALGNGITLSRYLISYKDKANLREWMDDNHPELRSAYLDNPALGLGI